MDDPLFAQSNLPHTCQWEEQFRGPWQSRALCLARRVPPVSHSPDPAASGHPCKRVEKVQEHTRRISYRIFRSLNAELDLCEQSTESSRQPFCHSWCFHAQQAEVTCLREQDQLSSKFPLPLPFTTSIGAQRKFTLADIKKVSPKLGNFK